MTADVKVIPGPAETLARMGPAYYEAAYKRGMSLSAYLEKLHPQSEYKDGLSALSRLLKEAGIITTSIPEEGIYATELRDFESHPQARELIPEWIAAQVRRATFGQPVQRASGMYTSEDDVLNTWARPYFDQATPRRLTRQLTPAIPLSELVAVTTPIDGNAYRVFYLNDDATETREVRVAESTNVPKATLTEGQYTVRLYKYGRSLDITYEAIRRFRIDKIAYFLQRLAIQTEADKVAAAIDVLVNGDGNANTAAENFNLTTLDSSTSSGVWTLKAWLAFKSKFLNPYVMTTAITRSASAIDLMLLNAGTANNAVADSFGGFRPINPNLTNEVALGITDDIAANKVLAFDNRLALERVFETGSNIQEVQRWSNKQVQELTMTETEGYAVLDRDAAKILTINA